jgi:hypothetical protein
MDHHGPPLLPDGRRLAATLLLLLAACLSSARAISSAEASYIAHRQLLAMNEEGIDDDGDLPTDFEPQDRLGADAKSLTFPNDRLRRAYIALQAWRRAFYSDPKGFTANWTGTDVCSYNGVICTQVYVVFNSGLFSTEISQSHQ